MKRIIKGGVNKRRQKGKYLRLGKLCNHTNTATKQGLEKLCLKLFAANKSNHRLLLKQRRGMKQEESRQKGKALKRERVQFEPLLGMSLEELVKVNCCKYAFDEPEKNLS